MFQQNKLKLLFSTSNARRRAILKAIRKLPRPQVDLAAYVISLVYLPGIFCAAAIIQIIRCENRCELRYNVNSFESYSHFAITHAYLGVFFFILPLLVFVLFNRYLKYQLIRAPYINTKVLSVIGALLLNAAVSLNLAVYTKTQPDAHPIDTNRDDYIMFVEECEKHSSTHELFGHPKTYAPGVYNNSQTPNADAQRMQTSNTQNATTAATPASPAEKSAPNTEHTTTNKLGHTTPEPTQKTVQAHTDIPTENPTPHTNPGEITTLTAENNPIKAHASPEEILNTPELAEKFAKKLEEMEWLINIRRIFEYDQPPRADFYSIPLGSSSLQYHWLLIATGSIVLAMVIMILALLYYLGKISRDKTIRDYLILSPLTLPLVFASFVILMLSHDWLRFFHSFLVHWFFNTPLPITCKHFTELFLRQPGLVTTFPGLFIFIFPAIGFMSYLLGFIVAKPLRYRDPIASATIMIWNCCLLGWVFYWPIYDIDEKFHIYVTSGLASVLFILVIMYLWYLNIRAGIKKHKIELHIFIIMLIFLIIGLAALSYSVYTDRTTELYDTLFPSGLLHIFSVGFTVMLFLGWFYQKFSNIHQVNYSYPLALIQLYSAFLGVLSISGAHLFAGLSGAPRHVLLESCIYYLHYTFLCLGLILLIFSHVMIIVIILHARYKKKKPVYFENPDVERTHFLTARAHILNPRQHQKTTKTKTTHRQNNNNATPK